MKYTILSCGHLLKNLIVSVKKYKFTVVNLSKLYRTIQFIFKILSLASLFFSVPIVLMFHLVDLIIDIIQSLVVNLINNYYELINSIIMRIHNITGDKIANKIVKQLSFSSLGTGEKGRDNCSMIIDSNLPESKVKSYVFNKVYYYSFIPFINLDMSIMPNSISGFQKLILSILVLSIILLPTGLVFY